MRLLESVVVRRITTFVLLHPMPCHPRPGSPTCPQLPCFGYGKPLESLRARFRPELTPSQAAAYMKGLILGAYDKWTTG